jgi:hypothetical protein
MASSVVTQREYSDYVEKLHAHEVILADQLAGFHGIEQVLGWMQQSHLGKAAVDIIGQDEFEYDFLIQLEAGGRWLAFGVT